MTYKVQDGYVGGEAMLYYNAGSFESPDWQLVSNRSDIAIPDSRTAVASPIAAQWPFIGHLSGSRDLGMTFSANKNRGASDTVTAALLAAYDAGTPLEFMICDGPKEDNGTNYRRLTVVLTKADEADPMDNAVTWAFEGKFALNAARLPTRGTVSA